MHKNVYYCDVIVFLCLENFDPQQKITGKEDTHLLLQKPYYFPQLHVSCAADEMSGHILFSFLFIVSSKLSSFHLSCGHLFLPIFLSFKMYFPPYFVIFILLQGNPLTTEHFGRAGSDGLLLSSIQR